MRTTFPFISVSVYKKAISLILGLSALAWAVVDAIPNISFDPNYDTFYQEQYHTLMGLAQEIVPQAYRSIMKQWHLSATGLRHPLLVVVNKEDSDTLQRRPAYTRMRARGNEMNQRLVIDIGAYMQHPNEDLKRILTHEMAHVILNDAVIDGPQAAPIPAWFHEGLAQSVTSEGHEAVNTVFDYWRWSSGQLNQVGLCDLDGPVDAFAHGPDNRYCYPEYYLAVQRLRQLGGSDTLAQLIKGMHDGIKIQDLIPAVAHMDWPDFKQEIERYTRAVFDGTSPIP